MASQFKAVLFDFNGIIIDDEPLHLRLFQELCHEEGIELSTHAYYERYLGYDDKGCLSAVFRDHGRSLAPEKLQQLIDKKAHHYLQSIQSDARLFPGVMALVKHLEGRVLRAIVSGALRQEIIFICQKLGLADAFDVIVSANDTHFGKPHPEGYLKGLEALQARGAPLPLSAEACLVIEDSLAGIEAAHAAGMRCLAITNSYAKEELQSADWVRTTLEGLQLEELV